MTLDFSLMKKAKKQKKQVLKLDIICGQGQHRTWTAAFAEFILLNKYGNQPDYFWKLSQFATEYLKLIKLCGKLAKQFGQEKLAWYIYQEPQANFDESIGLIIWKLKGYKFNNPAFKPEQLTEIYRNRFRPHAQKDVQNPQIDVIVEKSKANEFLGDI